MNQNTKLPSVLDTIKSVNRRHLNKVINKRFTNADLQEPPENWLDDLIERFDAVNIIESYDNIIVGQTHLEQDLLNPEQLELSVTSVLYTKEDLETLLSTDDEDFAPAPYAYELTEWKYLLGYRTWIPEDFSKHEKVQFVADMIWELTWFGDTEETAEDGSNELKDSLEKSKQEYEEHKDDPEYFKPADEVFKKYRDELRTTDPEIRDTIDDHWSDVSQEFLHRMLDIYLVITKPLVEQNKQQLINLANLLADND